MVNKERIFNISLLLLVVILIVLLVNIAHPNNKYFLSIGIIGSFIASLLGVLGAITYENKAN